MGESNREMEMLSGIVSFFIFSAFWYLKNSEKPLIDGNVSLLLYINFHFINFLFFPV